MCGIVGYVGPRPVLPILIEGLRKLEYRGYDSAGVAVVANGTLLTPPVEGILGGVTRDVLIEAAEAEGIPIDIRQRLVSMPPPPRKHRQWRPEQHRVLIPMCNRPPAPNPRLFTCR